MRDRQSISSRTVLIKTKLHILLKFVFSETILSQPHEEVFRTGAQRHLNNTKALSYKKNGWSGYVSILYDHII